MNALSVAIPIIVSLIILEGLLSVDNAMVLAAMVSHLPGKQKVWALRAGILGAYVLRGTALLCVSFLIANPWLKIAGGTYLVYLMVSHLGIGEEGKTTSHSPNAESFWITVVAVEIADTAFSIDNVVTAVAFSQNLHFVIIGVFIGIATMRFVAGFFVKLMERLPVLSNIAYLLVGLVGFQLLSERFAGIDLNEVQKFICIITVIAFGVLYEHTPLLQRLFGPFVRQTRKIFGLITKGIDWILKPLGWLLYLLLAPLTHTLASVGALLYLLHGRQAPAGGSAKLSADSSTPFFHVQCLPDVNSKESVLRTCKR